MVRGERKKKTRNLKKSLRQKSHKRKIERAEKTKTSKKQAFAWSLVSMCASTESIEKGGFQNGKTEGFSTRNKE